MSFYSIAQDTIYYDKLELKLIDDNYLYVLKSNNKPFTGVQYRLYPNGNKVFESNIFNGKPEGKYTSYYTTGNVKIIWFYRDGKKEGKKIFYYENGKIKQEGYFHFNKKKGQWKYWSEDGTLIKTEFYDNGNLIEK